MLTLSFTKHYLQNTQFIPEYVLFDDTQGLNADGQRYNVNSCPGISAKISDRLETGTLLSYKLQNNEKTRASDLIKTPKASHEQLLRAAVSPSCPLTIERRHLDKCSSV